MRLFQTILLSCTCLAASWAADTRPREQRSISLPYFVQEPTDLSHKTIASALLLRRGSSNVYYYSIYAKVKVLLPLQCLAVAPDALSNKSIEYSWTLNNVEVTKWRGKTSITLENADLSSHIAKYRCVASLRDLATGKTRSIYSSELTLLPPPDYPTVSGHPLPNEGRCLRNSYLVINSSCYMEPIPYIHWNNVENLFRNGDAYMTATSALVIKCNALSGVLDITATCLNNLFRFINGDNYLVEKVADSSINPIQPESVDYPVQYLTYSVGDSIYISCRSALFFQNPKQVKFYKNNPNNELEEVAARRPFKLFFQLNVTLEDAGEYTCEVTLSNGTKFRDETRLTVLAPPYWIRKPPTVVYINDGESLYLDYEVGGSPIPEKLEYRVHGDVTGVSVDEFTTKNYVDTRVHRRGESYSLELRFANDQAEMSTSVAVIVIKRMQMPTINAILVAMSENENAKENWLFLTCSTEFDTLLERPQVNWVFPFNEERARDPTGEQPIMNEEVKSQRVISLGGNVSSTLSDLHANNQDIIGNYTCAFSAFYGTVSKTIEITKDLFTTPVTVAVTTTEFGEHLWWIIAIVVLFLFIMLFVLAIFCWRNTRGRSYNVDEKERRQGNDPLVEMRKEGFADYRRPDQDPQRIARDDLDAAVSMNESLDGSELDGYGDENADKFNEDGSFIGLYSTNQRAAAAQPHNASGAAAARSAHAQANVPYAYSTMAPGVSANKRQQTNSPRMVAHSGSSGARTLPHPNNLNRPQVIPTQIESQTAVSPRVYSPVVAPHANVPDLVHANAMPYAPLTPPHSESNMRDSHSQLDGNAGQIRGPARFGVATPLSGVITHNNTLV